MVLFPGIPMEHHILCSLHLPASEKAAALRLSEQLHLSFLLLKTALIQILFY